MRLTPRLTTEYHIIKTFDDITKKGHCVIKDKSGEIIYETSYNELSYGDRPSLPSDYLEAALEGRRVHIDTNYERELQDIAFQLHLLNVCKTDNEKENPQTRSKLKQIVMKLISLFT